MSPPPVSDARKKETRRKFLVSAGVGGAVLFFSLSGYLPVRLKRSQRLRPPGALAEPDFLAACIKCGQCVQVCPVSALKPADLTDGFGVGVPYYEPRLQACDFSCDVGQCILACPTGALTYHKPVFAKVFAGTTLPALPVLLAKAKEPESSINLPERMGLARVAHPEACLSVRGLGVKGSARGPGFKGKKRWAEIDRWSVVKVASHEYELERCDLCVRECPIQGAISMELLEGKPTPVVHEACVGCGVCEMMCPADPVAIVIDPIEPPRSTT